ncbi:hypothetical protein GRS48_01575 [Halorubrum sp. JWXQ-INN 858]|uniref:hypothetical protein n=1 Tax=Halorubrum sp. JWXQ-INN 858 TaxID=2690782 RepID=UPI00135AF6A1|nr:hypothetical protein [Halorubrum sp. JWXQ-INN 858]MWV63517.1 hypothetical protein [Halorubrum sp. JWXQ-INN 858]
MSSLVYLVAVVGTIGTLLMIVGMLYLVWISMGDETHAPAIDSADRPGFGDADADAPDTVEGETA